VPDHGYSIAALVKLDRFDLVALPVVVHVADKPPDAFMSPIDDPFELRSERQPFAIRGGQADQLIDITRVERLKGAPDDVYVLLRNPRSPSLVPPRVPA
jgi:hypothetical protein